MRRTKQAKQRLCEQRPPVNPRTQVSTSLLVQEDQGSTAATDLGAVEKPVREQTCTRGSQIRRPDRSPSTKRVLHPSHRPPLQHRIRSADGICTAHAPGAESRSTAFWSFLSTSVPALLLGAPLVPWGVLLRRPLDCPGACHSPPCR